MGTKTEQKKSIVSFRVFVIVELRRKIVTENGLRPLKRHAVILYFLRSLCGTPRKLDF
jgi:hypothetical protein